MQTSLTLKLNRGIEYALAGIGQPGAGNVMKAGAFQKRYLFFGFQEIIIGLFFYLGIIIKNFCGWNYELKNLQHGLKVPAFFVFFFYADVVYSGSAPSFYRIFNRH